MRTQGSLRLILNTKLWAQMQIDKASEKSIRITAMDTEDQGVKVFLISVRWRVWQRKVFVPLQDCLRVSFASPLETGVCLFSNSRGYHPSIPAQSWDTRSSLPQGRASSTGGRCCLGAEGTCGIQLITAGVEKS